MPIYTRYVNKSKNFDNCDVQYMNFVGQVFGNSCLSTLIDISSKLVSFCDIWRKNSRFYAQHFAISVEIGQNCGYGGQNLSQMLSLGENLLTFWFLKTKIGQNSGS